MNHCIMIEKFEEIKCFCKSKKNPIILVVIDEKLKIEEKLRCTECATRFKNQPVVLLFEEALEQIQTQKNQQFQLLSHDLQKTIKKIIYFQEELGKLKTSLFNSFTKIETSLKDWVTSLMKYESAEKEYSLLQEIQNLKYQNPGQLDMIQIQVSQQLSKINIPYANKINHSIETIFQELLSINLQEKIDNVLGEKKNIQNCNRISEKQTIQQEKALNNQQQKKNQNSNNSQKKQNQIDMDEVYTPEERLKIMIENFIE